PQRAQPRDDRVVVGLQPAALADTARRRRAFLARAGAGTVAAVVLGRAPAPAFARQRPFFGCAPLLLFAVELRLVEHGVDAQDGDTGERTDHEIGEAAIPHCVGYRRRG